MNTLRIDHDQNTAAPEAPVEPSSLLPRLEQTMNSITHWVNKRRQGSINAWNSFQNRHNRPPWAVAAEDSLKSQEYLEGLMDNANQSEGTYEAAKEIASILVAGPDISGYDAKTLNGLQSTLVTAFSEIKDRTTWEVEDDETHPNDPINWINANCFSGNLVPALECIKTERDNRAQDQKRQAEAASQPSRSEKTRIGAKIGSIVTKATLGAIHFAQNTKTEVKTYVGEDKEDRKSAPFRKRLPTLAALGGLVTIAAVVGGAMYIGFRNRDADVINVAGSLLDSSPEGAESAADALPSVGIEEVSQEGAEAAQTATEGPAEPGNSVEGSNGPAATEPFTKTGSSVATETTYVGGLIDAAQALENEQTFISLRAGSNMWTWLESADVGDPAAALARVRANPELVQELQQYGLTYGGEELLLNEGMHKLPSKTLKEFLDTLGIKPQPVA